MSDVYSLIDLKRCLLNSAAGLDGSEWYHQFKLEPETEVAEGMPEFPEFGGTWRRREPDPPAERHPQRQTERVPRRNRD